MWLRFQLRSFVGGLLVGFLATGELSAQNAPPVDAAVPRDGITAGEIGARSSVEDLPANASATGSGQISVTGGTPQSRVMFRSFLRDLRRDFRWSIFKIHQMNQSVSDRDAWQIPIEVELWGEVSDVYRGDDARMRVKLMFDDRLRILIAVRLHDRFDEEEFRIEAVRALVVEQMLTPFAAAPNSLNFEALQAPEWLVHGFDEMIQHRRSGQSSVFYKGVLESGLLLSPEQLFVLEDPEALDPISYAAFRISAASMVNALLKQEEGDFGLRELLGELTISPSATVFPLLRKHFPAFREMDQGLEKWWTLQVATMGQQQRFEFLDRLETEEWLTEALTIRFDGTEETLAVEPKKRKFLDRFLKPKEEEAPAGPFVGSIEQYSEFLNRKGADQKLAQSFNRLQHLKTFGFPLYRPLLDRYDGVFSKLASRDLEGINAELSELAALRGTIRNTLERAEDYLNHFEATQSPERSEVFEDYMRLRKEFERRGSPERNDRITKYLDSLEQEFR